MEVPKWQAADCASDPDFRTASRQVGLFLSENGSKAAERQLRYNCRDLVQRQEMCFSFWQPRLLFDPVWAAIVTIAMQPFVLRIYIGVTTDPEWRWQRCKGHNNMQPHREHYDRMFVISAERGKSITAYEQLFQAKLWKLAHSKCAFSEHYRKGPVKDNDVHCLYACVTIRNLRRRLE